LLSSSSSRRAPYNAYRRFDQLYAARQAQNSLFLKLKHMQTLPYSYILRLCETSPTIFDITVISMYTGLCVYREDSENEYSFYLEAAISTSKQVDEDRLTYLNKGSLFSTAISSVHSILYDMSSR